jgi:hypothetical protein
MSGRIRFNKKSKAIRERAKQLGYAVSFCGSGHLKFTHPDLSGPVFAACTPRSATAEYRYIKKLEKALNH